MTELKTGYSDMAWSAAPVRCDGCDTLIRGGDKYVVVTVVDPAKRTTTSLGVIGVLRWHKQHAPDREKAIRDALAVYGDEV